LFASGGARVTDIECLLDNGGFHIGGHIILSSGRVVSFLTNVWHLSNLIFAAIDDLEGLGADAGHLIAFAVVASTDLEALRLDNGLLDGASLASTSNLQGLGLDAGSLLGDRAASTHTLDVLLLDHRLPFTHGVASALDLEGLRANNGFPVTVRGSTGICPSLDNAGVGNIYSDVLIASADIEALVLDLGDGGRELIVTNADVLAHFMDDGDFLAHGFVASADIDALLMDFRHIGGNALVATADIQGLVAEDGLLLSLFIVASADIAALLHDVGHLLDLILVALEDINGLTLVQRASNFLIGLGFNHIDCAFSDDGIRDSNIFVICDDFIVLCLDLLAFVGVRFGSNNFLNWSITESGACVSFGLSTILDIE